MSVRIVMQKFITMTSKLKLPVESRMQGDLQVRFGGRSEKTYRRKAARRLVAPSLHISGSVENGQDNVCEAVKLLRKADYFMVLQTQGGTRHLVNTLPNTFSFRSTDSKSSTDDARDFAISAKAMSDFIRLE